MNSIHIAFELEASTWQRLEQHLSTSIRLVVANGSALRAEEVSSIEVHSDPPVVGRQPYYEAATCLLAKQSIGNDKC